MDASTLMLLLLSCAPLVDPATARAVIAVESTANPHAIGVVGGRLERQPRNRPEALSTAKALRDAGWNFSVGLAQINVRNLARLRLDLETAFEPCANVTAMQTILIECLERSAGTAAPGIASQRSLRRALSCYYSGNFVTGFEHGYVRKVALQSARPN